MSNSISKSLAFLFAPLIGVNTALTADDSYLAETDFFGEAPVVLTVSRMHKPLSDAPASVTVIDRDMIENSGAREIADLFRMVPGFIVGYEDGLRPAVTYQGLGRIYSRRMQVLVDGRSVFTPLYGGVPWSNLPLLLHDIERIEITRGPNAVTYGANAFLATINIITRHAAEDLGGAVIVTHDLDNNRNAQDAYLRYGNHFGDLDWRISFGREQDDGRENFFKKDDALETHDEKEINKLNIRTDFLTAHNQHWTVQAGINDATFSVGEGDLVNPYHDETTVNSYQNIKWELIDEHVQTTAKLNHTRQRADGDFIASDPPFSTTMPVELSSDRTELEVYQNRSLTEALTWNYGLNFRQDKIRSFFLFHNYDTYRVDAKNLFTSIEWQAPSQTIVDLGVFVEDSDIASTESSYRLSLIHPIDAHHLRFVSSSAKRIPILWELSGNTSIDVTVDPSAVPANSPLIGANIPFRIRYLGNQGLEPETIVSNEVGLLSRFLDAQLTTDVKLFQYQIKQMIDEVQIASPLPPLYIHNEYGTMVNGGDLKVRGLELFFNYSPSSKRHRVYGGLSYLDVKGFRPDEEYENSYPDKVGYFGGHINFNDQHQLSGTLYFVDDRSWIDTTKQLEGYERLDLRYRYLLDRKHELKLELIGSNLLDGYYEYRHYTKTQELLLARLSGRF